MSQQIEMLNSRYNRDNISVEYAEGLLKEIQVSKDHSPEICTISFCILLN